MSATPFVLKAAPIIEAVVDIDCDLPPAADIEALDTAAKAAFGDRYPKPQRRMLSEHEVRLGPGQGVAVNLREGLQALQYLTEDSKQLVQLRPNGFSFNRLAPYSSLDDYLPEIERAWKLFVSLARPVVCRAMRMRYINRIELPLAGGKLDLEQYLKIAPRTADENRLVVSGFFVQQTVQDAVTGSRAAVVLATQPTVNGRLPLIFDITAERGEDFDPGDWAAISGRIAMLRDLKNLIFRDSLQPKCLDLFRP